ncbi:MAG: hypothetical protein ABH829_04545 [archaeon]
MLSIRKAVSQGVEVISSNTIIIFPILLYSIFVSLVVAFSFMPILGTSQVDLMAIDLSLLARNTDALFGALIIDALFLLILGAFFNSITLSMIKEGWKRGITGFALSFGSTYFAPILGVTLAKGLITGCLLSLAALPLFIGPSVPAVIISATSVFLLVIVLLGLFWVKESVVAENKGVAAALRNSWNFTRLNLYGTIMIIAAVAALEMMAFASRQSVPQAATPITPLIGVIALFLELFLSATAKSVKLAAYLETHK